MSPIKLFSILAVLLPGILAACSDGSNSDNTVEDGAFAFTDPCDVPEKDIVIHVTDASIEFVRTPDACFESLDGYNYAPNYAMIDGMQMHYVDEGPRDGEVVLMLHGQPSWSYLYRKMIPVLVDAGYRVIAADHIGMGRSDKPVDPRIHTYEQQVRWNKMFVDELGLSNITLFVQDWGSLIGLRVAGETPDLFARIVIANGNLPLIPQGLNPYTLPVFEIIEPQPEPTEFFLELGQNPGFQKWIDYAASAPYLFAADVVQILSIVELSEDELNAYNAPFPNELHRAAIRAFPSMVAGVNGEAFPAYEALGMFDRPFLTLAGEFDKNLGSEATQNMWIAHVPGAIGQEHARYEAHHFIQEDVGPEIAAKLVNFMSSNPIPKTGQFYNVRYCEVLLVSITDGVLQAQVYATLGLNKCPQEAWDALDAADVALENGAFAAIKNGPRYWVLDQLSRLEDSSDTPPPEGVGDIATFAGIEMRLAAIVTLDGQNQGENLPYTINEVQRSTIFEYVAGRRIYELSDAQGGRYVMQSMSQIIDANQQLHDLATLGERLELPEGWEFNTRILEEDLELVANGIALVITDDLSNTYQKVE